MVRPFLCVGGVLRGEAAPLRRYVVAPKLPKQASSYPPPRTYFYHLDVHGKLFLHDTWPRNITTCYKDTRFLNLFFRQLQPTLSQDCYSSVFPFNSLCGKEVNYLEPADTPIVFTDLILAGNAHSHETSTRRALDKLVWGGTLTFDFDPAQVWVHPETGYVYHPSPNTKLCKFALISSSTVLRHIAPTLDVEKAQFQWNGETFPISTIS
ncbi:hypothetical protein H4219_002900 [Mycoemilia scoparia]|uniref:Uncharacterized protein n=1 Tax=Mycoemilia scoparia TaxID=417184 RepID=A0A9W8A4B9_9FUNG|nr:hypothetical protein H4219_002900 [Mycoemilia scoparia]